MIVFAPYPDNFCLDQSALSFYYYNINTNNSNTNSKTGYQKALTHFLNVRQWCNQNLKYPYQLDLSDILHTGVRVRLSNSNDIAYFTLKWC